MLTLLFILMISQFSWYFNVENGKKILNVEMAYMLMNGVANCNRTEARSDYFLFL